MKQPQGSTCPICQKANPDFEGINSQINQAKTPKEKAPFAKQLIAKVEEVLQEHGSAQDPLTEKCRSILTFRKKTAELILQVEKLADRR